MPKQVLWNGLLWPLGIFCLLDMTSIGWTIGSGFFPLIHSTIAFKHLFCVKDCSGTRDSIVDKTKSLPRWSLRSSGGDRWLENKYSCCGEKQFHVRREGLSFYTRVVRGRASRRWPLSRWDLKEVRERAIQFCEALYLSLIILYLYGPQSLTTVSGVAC